MSLFQNAFCRKVVGQGLCPLMFVVSFVGSVAQAQYIPNDAKIEKIKLKECFIFSSNIDLDTVSYELKWTSVFHTIDYDLLASFDLPTKIRTDYLMVILNNSGNVIDKFNIEEESFVLQNFSQSSVISAPSRDSGYKLNELIEANIDNINDKIQFMKGEFEKSAKAYINARKFAECR